MNINNLVKIGLALLVFLNLSIWFDIYRANESIGQLEITFIDVGQGDSILIKTPNNHIGIIDAGPDNSLAQNLPKLLPPNKKNIDFILMTHPDKDHIYGFKEILQSYEVGKVFMLKTNKNTIILNEILGIIKSKNIPTIQLTNAVDFNFDGLDFNTLWPSTNLDVYNFSDFNDTSISFLISYKNFDLLTMGDLSSEYEEKAIKDINNLTDIDLEVLKASHHGSKHSSSLKLLNILTPEIIVFSAGRNNSYSHPNPEVIENSNKIGSDVYRTDISGNIKFVINSSEDYKIFKQH